jgi:hypothetical protein
MARCVVENGRREGGGENKKRCTYMSSIWKEKRQNVSHISLQSYIRAKGGHLEIKSGPADDLACGPSKQRELSRFTSWIARRALKIGVITVWAHKSPAACHSIQWETDLILHPSPEARVLLSIPSCRGLRRRYWALLHDQIGGMSLLVLSGRDNKTSRHQVSLVIADSRG